MLIFSGRNCKVSKEVVLLYEPLWGGQGQVRGVIQSFRAVESLSFLPSAHSWGEDTRVLSV